MNFENEAYELSRLDDMRLFSHPAPFHHSEPYHKVQPHVFLVPLVTISPVTMCMGLFFKVEAVRQNKGSLDAERPQGAPRCSLKVKNRDAM
jgi:hypothetical protein